MNEDLQQQFVRDMLTESNEGLDRFDESILQLEQGRGSNELLNDIFRVIHTLKGTAGCLGFVATQDTAHAGENLLDLLRNGRREPDAEVIAVLFAMSDELRARLQRIEDTGSDGDSPDQALVDRLAAAMTPGKEEPAATASAGEPEIPMPPAAFGLFEDDDEPVAEPPNGTDEKTAAETAPVEEPPAPISNAGWGLFEDIEPVAAEEPVAPVEPEPKVASKPVAAPPPKPTETSESSATASAASRVTHNSSVRVDVSLLDQLMNLVGELVLTRNQLLQVSQVDGVRDSGVKQISQRLNLITTDLQEGIMKTRMQQIHVVWSKFPRIIRDIAQKLGKQVRFETFGADTELDRTILEAIRDPLTHIVRNSLDHGLESPEARVAAGKPEEGFLLMRAFHEGGQVNLEIVDDGAGVNLPKVKARALERGLITADEANRMSDREVANLVFMPGFSTAEKVSDVSGRGVGMDVVRTNIEKIGGSVDLLSRPGEGTTIKIKIPLTLAIIPALIVTAEKQRFAIPQVNLLELVRLDPTVPNQGIEEVYGAPVFRLRGRLLPLVYLRDELSFAPRKEGSGNIVVLRADEQEFGLVVDGVCDTEEIVVKPLSKQLKNLPMFAGATIMGDGRVALIMDLLGLAERARVLHTQGQHRNHTVQQNGAEGAHQFEDASQLLLFSLPGRPNLGLDLDQATRLEQFPRASFERSGPHEAVQYRGGILPIVRMSQVLGGGYHGGDDSAEEEVPVIVCRAGERLVGLAVEDIRDIIETRLQLQPGSATPGTLGSAVVEGKIIDVVDLPTVLRQAFRISA